MFLIANINCAAVNLVLKVLLLAFFVTSGWILEMKFELKVLKDE